MLPSLLPWALFVLAAAAVGLGLLIRFFAMARPGAALVIRRGKAAPVVMMSGGTFIGRGVTVDHVLMTSRSVTVRYRADRALAFHDGTFEVDVEIELAPRREEEHILEIARSVGADRHNDDERLAEHLGHELRAPIENFVRQIDAATAGLEERTHALTEKLERYLTSYDILRATLVVRGSIGA